MHLCYLLDGFSMMVQFLLLRSRFVDLRELTSELDETALEDFRALPRRHWPQLCAWSANISCDLFSVIAGQSICGYFMLGTLACLYG